MCESFPKRGPGSHHATADWFQGLVHAYLARENLHNSDGLFYTFAQSRTANIDSSSSIRYQHSLASRRIKQGIYRNALTTQQNLQSLTPIMHVAPIPRRLFPYAAYSLLNTYVYSVASPRDYDMHVLQAHSAIPEPLRVTQSFPRHH